MEDAQEIPDMAIKVTGGKPLEGTSVKDLRPKKEGLKLSVTGSTSIQITLPQPGPVPVSQVFVDGNFKRKLDSM